MSDNHTPVPWAINGKYSGVVDVGPACNDMVIADIWFDNHEDMCENGDAEALAIANAEFIVKACNHHAELVEGYRALRDQVDMNEQNLSESVRQELSRADELLAKLDAEK